MTTSDQTVQDLKKIEDMIEQRLYELDVSECTSDQSFRVLKALLDQVRISVAILE